MRPSTIVLLIVLGVLIALAVGLYFLGKKAQKKQAEQQELLDQNKQTVSMLIIDKKRMKMKEAGLPAMVLESTPKYLRGMKVPVVKAKVGPRVMSLLCDEKVFPNVPVKKEVKAVVSGLYITEVKGIRGSVDTTQTEKKGFFAKFKKNK